MLRASSTTSGQRATAPAGAAAGRRGGWHGDDDDDGGGGGCASGRTVREARPEAAQQTHRHITHITHTHHTAGRRGVVAAELGVSNQVTHTSGPVSTGMGDRLRTGKPLQYATSHSGQVSFLPYVGREMSTGQSAVMLCGWGLKAR